MKKYTVIHHTVTPPGTGPSMTDYHLVLDYVGGQVNVHEHHQPEYITPRAVGGANSISYSVALVGNYERYPVPMILFNGLVHALAVKMRRGEIPRDVYTHRSIGLSLSRPYHTACPGAYMIELFPELKLRLKRYGL